MSKRSTGSDNKLSAKISFMAFWQFIASELGNSRLKINNQATSINNFIDRTSDHKGYLRNVIQLSYKRSQCHHLHAPINLLSVLDVLGETAFELQGKQCDDLMDIELLEEIAWYISERYMNYMTICAPENSDPEGQILSFPKAKIRRANARQ